jgi:16S rRNA (uracil1498-N3)-methyltransferase
MSEKKLHRFIGSFQLGQGTMRLDDADVAHHMRSVLKLQPGEIIIVGDGTGLEAQCRILEYQRDAVLVEGISVGRNPNELALQTTLYCAVLKADHFELAAQKATEVGVTQIVPILTTRTVKFNLRFDRVQRVVQEAAELAGRGLVPRVRETMNFEHVLTEASRNDVNYFFDPSGSPFIGPAKSTRTAGLFIGPEGGWDDREVTMAREYGMRIATLGGLILRAETAVIVASYLVAHGRKM